MGVLFSKKELNLHPKFCQPGKEAYTFAQFRDFHDSNYLKIYRKNGIYKNADIATRRKLLKESLIDLKIWESVKKDSFTKSFNTMDPDLVAVNLWSGDLVYRQMNAAILTDDPDLLEDYGMLIRAVNHFLTDPKNRAPHEVLLYRGTKLEKDQYASVGEGASGKLSRQPIFIAGSTSIKIALKFAKDNCPILEFKVPKGCRNCTRLPPEAVKYAGEEEWLLPPYTVVEHVGQREEMGRLIVTYEVKENLNSPPCPSCLIMVDKRSNGLQADVGSPTSDSGGADWEKAANAIMNDLGQKIEMVASEQEAIKFILSDTFANALHEEAPKDFIEDKLTSYNVYFKLKEENIMHKTAKAITDELISIIDSGSFWDHFGHS